MIIICDFSLFIIGDDFLVLVLGWSNVMGLSVPGDILVGIDIPLFLLDNCIYCLGGEYLLCITTCEVEGCMLM